MSSSQIRAPIAATLMLVCFALLLGACAQNIERKLTPPEIYRTLDVNSPFLKVHMLDGRVYVLERWRIDEPELDVSGWGVVLDVDRQPGEQGRHTIPLDSVAIFETNVVHSSPYIAPMSIITGASVALSIYCIANPKTCFGSCPTFYVESGGDTVLTAEGFSASVSPSLESDDLDALYRARPVGRRFELRMTNEALETHVVRRADLLAVARREGQRALADADGRFWLTDGFIEPLAATTDGRDDRKLLAAVRELDDRERTSLADSKYLGTKETLAFEFDLPPGRRLGLVVAGRQSLLSTYLFYQTLAYMGEEAGAWIASFERAARAYDEADLMADLSPIGDVLGHIEILAGTDGDGPISVGEVGETGPLATNLHTLLLPELPPGRQAIELRLTRGHWRLDYVAVAVLAEQAEAVRLQPAEVRNGAGIDHEARVRLCNDQEILTTLPGDAYTLCYDLPEEAEDHELFLDSHGYYIEWMRQEWLAEQDQGLAMMMLANPELALYHLAPAYKQVEPEIEDMFWRSRYGKDR